MAAPAQGDGPGSEDYLFPFTPPVITASATTTLAPPLRHWPMMVERGTHPQLYTRTHKTYLTAKKDIVVS